MPNKDKNGVIYVAYGEKALSEATKSLNTLRRSNADVPATIVTDVTLARLAVFDEVIQFESDPYGRLAKLSVNRLTNYTNTVYLDADTRIFGSLEPMFDWLDRGWEWVIALSHRQRDQWLWHVGDEERFDTMLKAECVPIQMQGGVWGFRRTNAVRSLFATWRKEYDRFDSKWDQGALTRAIAQKPVKAMLMGRDFNDGVVVHHKFGRADRD